MNRVLIIDDDIELCSLLKDYLEPEGFRIETAHDSESGFKRVFCGEYSLVVLDVMLPGVNGFDVLRRIREQSRIPVIMLTARGDDVDRIVGLEMGADDYLAKPFNPRELVARIRAVQRRTEPMTRLRDAANEGLLEDGGLRLDPTRHLVTVNGSSLQLTSVEFSLLHVFMSNKGRVVSREDLAEQVLGRKLAVFDRSIDVHVSSLRKKLAVENQSPNTQLAERIKSVRGVGYLFTAVVPQESAGGHE